MQQLRTWAWRVFVPVLLVAGLLAGTAGAASAVPEYLWRDGHFTRPDAPVYPHSVDGWACHLAGQCRDTDEREPGDSVPIWHSKKAGERVQIECELGRYYKIHQGSRVPGWALISDVRAQYQPQPCQAGDF